MLRYKKGALFSMCKDSANQLEWWPLIVKVNLEGSAYYFIPILQLVLSVQKESLILSEVDS